MKKIVLLVLALVFAFSTAVLTVGAATSSPELDDFIVIVDSIQADNTDTTVTLTKPDTIDDDLKPEAAEDTLIAQRNIKFRSGVKLPVKFTATIKGITSEDKLYILAKDSNNNIDRIGVTVDKDGVLSFSLGKEYTTIAFFKEGAEEAAKDGSTSPATNDNGNISLILICVMAFAALLGTKKIKSI